MALAGAVESKRDRPWTGRFTEDTEGWPDRTGQGEDARQLGN